ncbi:unnamed protein product [Rhizophagus irregularis]|nr:unnamed protein product [Rhizophagus irregularis]
MSYIPSKGLKERKSIKRNRMNSLQKKKKKLDKISIRRMKMYKIEPREIFGIKITKIMSHRPSNPKHSSIYIFSSLDRNKIEPERYSSPYWITPCLLL